MIMVYGTQAAMLILTAMLQEEIVSIYGLLIIISITQKEMGFQQHGIGIMNLCVHLLIIYTLEEMICIIQMRMQ